MATIEITQPQLSGSGELLIGRELWDRQDYNPLMQGGQALLVYEKMRSTDGEISGGLTHLIDPLLAATWTVEPPKGEDSEKHDPTLLCRRALFGEEYSDPFSDTWADRLRHALLMVTFGMSAFEKVWGVDSEGHQTWARLAPIMPATVFKFTFAENGRLESATQRAWTVRTARYEEVTIPAAKLMVFTFGREGMNLFGRSVLRSAWKHWGYKAMLIETDGIRHERWGTGIPWVEIPESVQQVSDEEKAAIERITQNLRTNERQAIYLLPGRRLQITYPTGSQSDIIGSLKYHDQQESRSLVTEFMATGTAETGSRSVVTSKIDQMMLKLQGVGNVVEDVFNRQGLTELVDRNFGVQKGGYPRLQLEDMDKMTGTQRAEISSLLAKVGLLRADKLVRARYRDELDLPPEDEATLEPAPSQNPFGGGTAGGNGNQPGAEPGGVTEKKPSGAERLTFMGAESSPIGSPVTLSRLAEPHEQYCAFSEMKTYMRDEPQRIWHRIVEPWRKRLAARIASKVPGFSDDKLAARDFGAMPGIASPFENDLAAALLKVYVRGRRSVLDERTRQLAKTPVTSRDGVLLQEDDGDDEEFDASPSKEQRAWVATLAAAFVSALVTGMTSEASRQGIASRQAEASARQQEAEALAAINALSVARQQAELSGAVARSFGTGREEQGDTMGGEVEREYYSAIMDEGTCEPCAALDGMDQGPWDDEFETPNPGCLGDDNCRCVTVRVWKEEVA